MMGIFTMKTMENTWVRLLVGLLLVSILLISIFALLPGWFEIYGATKEEISAVYPGDEILTSPTIVWTHAISLSDTPEKVWPWIAQIGQSRGGFYSYTFIENMISQDKSFQNASQIMPQFQKPKPGDYIITDMLPLKEIKAGEYYLAAVQDFFGMGWTWVWYLKPEGMDNTRLILRMKIQASGEPLNPIATWFLDAGGFVMERGMLRGIQDRVEGKALPSPVEPLEISLWVGTLLVGLAAAWQVIRRKNWLFPLAIGLISVIALLVFTFIQPSNVLRIVVLSGLVVAVWQCIKREENPKEKEQK
jgi:hypothetical protein